MDGMKLLMARRLKIAVKIEKIVGHACHTVCHYIQDAQNEETKVPAFEKLDHPIGEE